MKTVAVLGVARPDRCRPNASQKAGFEDHPLRREVGWEKTRAAARNHVTRPTSVSVPSRERNSEETGHDTCLASATAGDVNMELSRAAGNYSRLDLKRCCCAEPSKLGQALEQTPAF